jgi:ABC-type multidrug transport system ATPase subunit
MNDDEPAIHAEGLHKHFGAVHALDDISLTVPAGTVLGLLGPNGAGKTTTVKILTTLIRPDAGSARVAGFDVVDQATQVRAAVGLAGQQAAVDPLLTGSENLDLIATLHHLRRREARRRVHELLERFDLTDAADRRASTYSGGMRRRLDLAASLIGQPQVLVLDEPTAGLDPASRQGLWATIRSLVDQGTTALLTTQYLEEADKLAHDIVVIDHGRVVATAHPTNSKTRSAATAPNLNSPTPATPRSRSAPSPTSPTHHRSLTPTPAGCSSPSPAAPPPPPRSSAHWTRPASRWRIWSCVAPPSTTSSWHSPAQLATPTGPATPPLPEPPHEDHRVVDRGVPGHRRDDPTQPLPLPTGPRPPRRGAHSSRPVRGDVHLRLQGRHPHPRRGLRR